VLVVGAEGVVLVGSLDLEDEAGGHDDEPVFEFALGPGVGTVRCRGFVIWSTRESPEKGNGEQGVGVRLTDLGVAEMRSIAEVVGRNL
jgi:hypothetical protein